MLREPSGGDGFAARSNAGAERLGDSDIAFPIDGGIQRGRKQRGTSEDPGTNPWLPYTLVGPDPKGKYRRVGLSFQRVRGVADGGDPAYALRPIPLLLKKEPQRVGKLKALGNGLCIPLAIEVIRAFLDAERG